MGSTASSVQSPNSESVLSLVSASPVTLFSAIYCRYCTVVKRTLDGIGTNYNTVELDKIDSNEGGQLAMGLREVTGQGTVPQARVMLKIKGPVCFVKISQEDSPTRVALLFAFVANGRR